MAIHRGPKIVTDGLVMNLDSASPKSYNPSQTGTAWYVAPVPVRPTGTIVIGPAMNSSPFYSRNDVGPQDYTFYIYTWTDTPYGRSYSPYTSILDEITVNDGALSPYTYYTLQIDVADEIADGYLFQVVMDTQYGGDGGYFELTYAQLSSFPTAFRFFIDNGNIYPETSDSTVEASYNTVPAPTAAIPQKNQFEFKDLTSRNNAIPVLTTYSSSNFGVLNFNSTNLSRATVTGSPDFNYGSGDFTWEVWAKPTANGYFLDHAPLNSGVMQRLGGILRYYNPVVGIYSPLYTGGPAIAANAWHNIVASRISGVTSLYLNGSFKVSGSDPCVYPQASYLSFGSTANFLVGYFLDGQIPVSRIYKGKGLTSSEVSQNYNALKGRFGIL